MSVSVIIRPSGMYPLIIVTVGVITALRKQKKLAVLAIVSLLLTIIQLAIMYKEFDIKKISIIDSVTIDHYLLARADALQHKVTFFSAREMRRKTAYYPAIAEHIPSLVAKYDKYVHNQLWVYVVNTPIPVLKAYGINLLENMSSRSYFLGILGNHIELVKISTYQNTMLMYPGIILSLLSVFLIGRRSLLDKSIVPIKKKCFELFIAGYLIYILLTLGLSSGQGDRLSLPAYIPSLILTGIWAQKFSRLFSFSSCHIKWWLIREMNSWNKKTN